MPRNIGVAPNFDTWNEKYEAWGHIRRMGKLAGTGFYIPPAWYQHFRMFPPTNHQFTEEKTLNPHNDKDAVQSALDGPDAKRRAVREELAMKSRSAASAGMRYMNLFWVKKPLDEMEREYNALTKRHGVQHDQAVKKVLQAHHERLAVRNRAHLIQAEEAKLKGGFISMREAMSVLKVLNTVQNERMAPHQYAALANSTEEHVLNSEVMEGRIVTREVPKVKSSAAAEKAAADVVSGDDSAKKDEAVVTAAATAGGEKAEVSTSPDGAKKATEGGVKILSLEQEFDLVEEIETSVAEGDSLPKLREAATDGTAATNWYTGASPFIDTKSPPVKPA